MDHTLIRNVRKTKSFT